MSDYHSSAASNTDLEILVKIAQSTMSSLSDAAGTDQCTREQAAAYFEEIGPFMPWEEIVEEFPTDDKVWSQFYDLRFDRRRMIDGLFEYTNRYRRFLPPLHSVLDPMTDLGAVRVAPGTYYISLHQDQGDSQSASDPLWSSEDVDESPLVDDMSVARYESDARMKQEELDPFDLYEMSDREILEVIHRNITFTQPKGECVNPELLLCLLPESVIFSNLGLRENP